MRTFEDVVRGIRQVHRIAEDERHIAFLNPSPVRPGHAIVIPKRVSDQLFELPAAEYAALMEFARATAVLLRSRLPCERVCMAVIGWQVRHAHVHLVPTNADGEFPPLPGAPVPEPELAELARRLARGS
jgi:histidine triad (HIT) family protein